jgi:hypothetical protein
MAMFVNGLTDALDDGVVISSTRWMDEILGGLEGVQDGMTSLRLTSGFEVPLLAAVSEEVVDEAFFFEASGVFTLDHRNDDFLFSGLDLGIGGDWNDFALSAGHRASRGFETSAVPARFVVGFDDEFPGTVVDLPSPEIWPGASDDDFVLAKDADLPTVLPGVEDFDYTVRRMSDGDLPARWTSDTLTFIEDGAVPGLTDDLGRPHGHDDWLF